MRNSQVNACRFRLESLKNKEPPETMYGMARYNCDLARLVALDYNLRMLLFIESNPKLPERVARKEFMAMEGRC